MEGRGGVVVKRGGALEGRGKGFVGRGGVWRRAVKYGEVEARKGAVAHGGPMVGRGRTWWDTEGHGGGMDGHGGAWWGLVQSGGVRRGVVGFGTLYKVVGRGGVW